jgi:hypothetical protein
MIELERPQFLKAIKHFLENSTVREKVTIINEIDKIQSMGLSGNFVVKQVFSDAMGKFPIG